MSAHNALGNNSQSEQYKAGKRFAGLFDQGRIPVVLHLADHDPNGIDMTRDNTERLALYARQEIEVRRIALNIDQVRRYNPPPNFAKKTDSRYAADVEQFGEECWELDALSPTVIADLIRVEIEAISIRRNGGNARQPNNAIACCWIGSRTIGPKGREVVLMSDRMTPAAGPTTSRSKSWSPPRIVWRPNSTARSPICRPACRTVINIA